MDETTILDVPQDIFTHILSEYLDSTAIYLASFTCKRWSHVIQTSSTQLPTLQYEGWIDTDILKWYIKVLKRPLDSDFAARVAAAGNIPVLYHLLDINHPLKSDIIKSAAENNQLNTLSWIRRETTLDMKPAMAAAAGRGHIDAMIFLRRVMNLEYDVESACAAAAGGYIDTLQVCTFFSSFMIVYCALC
jgi:hypothetical protein